MYSISERCRSLKSMKPNRYAEQKIHCVISLGSEMQISRPKLLRVLSSKGFGIFTIVDFMLYNLEPCRPVSDWTETVFVRFGGKFAAARPTPSPMARESRPDALPASRYLSRGKD